MLQILPKALAQVKAGNNSKNLLNDIRQIAILCISQNKSLKKYIMTYLSQYSEILFSYKNECYIY